MSKIIDITGTHYGKLKVIERADNKGKQTAWHCLCECGNKTIVQGGNLKGGHTTSCGCVQKDVRGKKSITHGYTRNIKQPRLYKIWSHIIGRCCCVTDKAYLDYGGRGITVCDEWRNDFQSFYDWAMNSGYTDKLTIDRENNDGNYEPCNCRWVTKLEQAHNRRSNVNIEYKGIIKTATQWSEIIGIKPATIIHRYKSGIPIDMVMSTKAVKNGKLRS